MKKEWRKEMDSDSNTGSAGSTQIQYKHVGEIQNGNTIEIQGQAGQFPAAAKNLSSFFPHRQQATTRLNCHCSSETTP